MSKLVALLPNCMQFVQNWSEKGVYGMSHVSMTSIGVGTFSEVGGGGAKSRCRRAKSNRQVGSVSLKPCKTVTFVDLSAFILFYT